MSNAQNQDQRETKLREIHPVVLSAKHRAEIRAVEEISDNQNGANKSWVHRALDDVCRHFALARKL